MAKNISLVMELLKQRPTHRKVQLPYKQMRGSRIKLTEEDISNIQRLMNTTHQILGDLAFDINISSSNLIRITAFTIGNIKFDITASTKNMLKVVEESGIRSRRENLLRILETI